MIPPAPVNVKLQYPTTVKPQDWEEEAKRWIDLNAEIGGNPNFFPLTVKAAYVFGVIHDICESVDWLLKHSQAWPVTYFSAFGLCASGMELLGRCLRGNSSTSGCTKDLEEGLRWLRSSSPKPGISESLIAVTSYNQYDIGRLVALRHFTLHGQATTQEGKAIALDIELLSAFPWLIGNAMERYWDQLLNSVDYCERLARARIFPLRSTPIAKMWRFFERKGTSAGTPFYGFNWQVHQYTKGQGGNRDSHRHS